MNTLALVVIARNEARCITRCLNSFAGHVDQMLVLDTGSSDDTVALARTAGAEVRHFTWCDDFAAARNAALQAASAHWHLVVDADEWLDSGAEALAAWRQHPARQQLGLVSIRNTFEAQGGPCVATASLPRLLPGSVRYRGRIHEQPVSAWPAVHTGLVLLHDGYAAAQKAPKAQRNEALLRLALAEQPGDAYLLYQLGSELAQREAHEEAVAALAQALQQADAQAGFRADLVRRLLVTLQALQEWTVAAQLLEAELPRYGRSAYFMLTAGNVFWNWAQARPDAAATLLPMAEDAWQQAMQAAGPATASQALQLEQAGQHAALSLAELYRQRGAALTAHTPAAAR